MSNPLGGQEQGCLGGSGSRQVSTWRGAKNRAAEAATVSESKSYLESNADPGGEEESRGVIGSIGA